MNHLLKLLDLSGEEINQILNLADQLKYEQKHGIAHPRLKGKTLGLVFEKESTRTRVSFEVGMYQLGGLAIYLNAKDLQMVRGEPAKDTARALSRYLDGLMIRASSQQEAEALAEYGDIPVINGMTDLAHPCQVLADLMTVREAKGSLEGLKACFLGDGHNMMNSTIAGCLKAGMQVAAACPEGCGPAPEVLAFARGQEGFLLTRDPAEAARGADVVATAAWSPAGSESECAARRAALAPYRLTEELLSLAQPDAMVLHCLPAHRGEEITEAVLEAHASEIFEEAENRLHAQKAVLVTLLAPDAK